MNHSDAFQKLADDARSRIAEISPLEAAAAARASSAVLVDVREHDEFAQERIPAATHLSRGILEQKIGKIAPVADTPIICYCAAGNRGALAADSLQKMGYTNVASIAGGLKAWKAQGLPLETADFSDLP